MTATSARSQTKKEEWVLATLVQGKHGNRPNVLNPSFGEIAEPGTIAGYTIHRTTDATSSYLKPHLEAIPSETTAEAILEIRRRGGLTWEEIGNLFQVSRRSVHNWANGRPTTAQHEHSIRQALSVIRRLDQGSQAKNRSRLLAGLSWGPSLFDLLKAGRFQQAAAQLAPTPVPELQRLPLSPDAQEARRPPTPGQLLEAEREPPHISASKTRAANALRIARKQAT